MKKFAKYLGWTFAIGAGLALIASIVILIAAQHHAELSDVIISLGDTEIAVHGLFDQPILTILVAWLRPHCRDARRRLRAWHYGGELGRRRALTRFALNRDRSDRLVDR
jgi:hypothetical protein